jgi:hypothetical protein
MPNRKTRISKRISAVPSKPRRKKSASSTAIVPQRILSVPEAIEKVLILGDLSSLTPSDRIDYYNRVCRSLGLNPLLQPFSYILFRQSDGGPAKLSLYANKSCTEQLRKIHGVSIIPPFRKTIRDGIVTVEVDARDKTGRTDTASGSVPLFKYKDGKNIDLTGTDLCNADMKCETKAKRRVTLSICGLAFLDESELDTMDIVGGVTREGRIYYHEGQEPDSRQGSREAAQKVLQEKLAGNMPLNPPADVLKQPEVPSSQPSPALFFTMPESFNGHYAEFVNIPNFLSSRQDLEEPLRLVFMAHKSKKTKSGTALVPAEELPALLEKLAGDLAITVKELKGR